MDLIGKFLELLVWAFNIAIFARVVMSWIRPNPNNPLVGIINQITEPILAPIRLGISKIAPNMGMFDFSPMVALVLLNFVVLPIIRKITS